jgi:hypothetical protein
MPLGIVSDDDFLSELNNSKVELDPNGVPISIGKIQELNRGRGNGNNAVPESLQKIIGETSILEGREAAIDLAGQFGVSESSVSAYKAGASSTATIDTPKRSLIDHLSIVKRNASRRAGRKLLAALDQITDEKLEEAPAGVLAGIAKSLSGVVKDLEPERVITDGTRATQFIVFAPQVSKESNFDIIELKE